MKRQTKEHPDASCVSGTCGSADFHPLQLCTGCCTMTSHLLIYQSLHVLPSVVQRIFIRFNFVHVNVAG